MSWSAPTGSLRGGALTLLLVELRVRYPRGLTGAAMRRVLPLGELSMMWRQLLDIKALAEATTQLDPASGVSASEGARA